MSDLAQADRLLELRGRCADLLTPVAVAVFADEVTVLKPEGSSRAWVVGPVEWDRGFVGGGLDMPRSQRRRLAEFARRGAKFDRLFIAHELFAAAAGSINFDAGGSIKTEGPTAAERTAASIDAALGSAGGAMSAVLRWARTRRVMLDPILFGVLDLPDGRSVVFELARWSA